MYAGYGSFGIWRAKTVNDEWVLDKNATVPTSVLKLSSECPSSFSLNGYKYLIMGWKRLLENRKVQRRVFRRSP